MTQTLQSLLQTGTQLLAARRLHDAHRLSELLLSRFRGHPQVHLFAADAAVARGDRNAAIGYLESAPPAAQRWAPLLLRRAEILLAERRRGEAIAMARAAGVCVEKDLWQLRTLARILSDCQDPQGAWRWLTEAHGQFPASVPILYDLAMAEFQLNRVDAADTHLAALLAIEPLHSGAVHLRSVLRPQTTEHNHVAALEALLERASRPANLETACCYALAKEYEDLGQYDKSFSALERGARAYRSTLKYDSENELANHAAIRAAFTRESFAALGAGFEAQGPIFIVGMPRTGTTLVERMLSSHGQVASVGELTDFPFLLAEMVEERKAATGAVAENVEVSLQLDFAELGRRYVASARQLAGDSPFFVDKLPYNFLYCGYILAALPSARVIHLTRDPLDTCYAIYKTLFFNAYSYSYDLDELTDYFIGYRRHMDHWHAVLPGRILDVAYEDLVRDPETQARRMLEWCGLPWDESVLEYYSQERPAMTASAMQVRRPPHTESIGAWRRVAARLGTVRERLARAGLLPPDEGTEAR